ncbi:hypothetical protein EDC96DRAFT_570086 [Choanephora cucurbitarum]|nr:hypothetical protein EDC96DRAFT_570086 [Choanephora cucurbitarum]
MPPKNAPQYILDLFAKIDALDSKVDDLVKRVVSVEETTAKVLAQVQLLQPSTSGQATPAVPVYKYAQPCTLTSKIFGGRSGVTLSRESQLKMIDATREGLLQAKPEELAFIMECQAHWPVAFAVQNSWSEMSKRVNAKRKREENQAASKENS